MRYTQVDNVVDRDGKPWLSVERVASDDNTGATAPECKDAAETFCRALNATETAPLYRVLASTLQAYRDCVEGASVVLGWAAAKHQERLKALVKAHMPSGSGFDNGTWLDVDASTVDKLVFHTNFHHMDDNGSYDGWTDHTIIVRPSLSSGFYIRITGPNRNDIKAYAHDVLHDCLTTEVSRYG